jgi:glycosyltransferase involved in cell wall biosynthesis
LQPRALRNAIESENLNLAAGTGIATYAEALAAAVRGLGHAPVGVFGIKAQISGRNEVLDEVQLHDARLYVKRPVVDLVRRARYWVQGNPLGARARRIRLSGQVHHAPGVLSSGLFDALYGVPHLGLRAEMHFKRYGQSMRLKGIEGADVFHATQPIALSLKGVPNLYTVHDIIPLRLPYATLANKREYYDLLSLLCRKADRIVTVSEFSRKDILSVFRGAEDRVVNTWQSVSLPQYLLDLPEEEVARSLRNAFGLAYKNYFLFIGAIEPKKNVRRLLAGYAASGSQRPLVLAGGLGWQFDDDVLAIKDERFLRYSLSGGLIRPERTVRHLDYVSRADLVLLLRGARALVFPSLYEGFGLPVLEAMLAATPVITSNVSSLPEVAGEAAEYVSPFETDSIARAFRKLDNDDERCRELAALGLKRAQFFSPERYRERLAELYRPLC